MLKIAKYVICLVFICTLCVPLIFINRDATKISLLENKKVAAFPNLFYENWVLNKTYFSDFEKYLVDNIGLRDPLIVFDIVFSMNFFKKIKIPGLVVGKDDYLFSYNDTVHGVNILSNAELEELDSELVALKRILDKKNMQLVVTTMPNADVVYSEFYPQNIFVVNNKTRLDFWTDNISQHDDIVVVNLKESLIEAKKNSQVYYKNFDPYHWNDNGAYYGYLETIKAIKKKWTDLTFIEKNECQITPIITNTFLHTSKFNFLAKNIGLTDVKYEYSFNTDAVVSRTHTQDGKLIYKTFINSSKPNAPKILIWGDSYAHDSVFLKLFAESFSELHIVIHWNSPEALYEALAMTDYGFDIFMIQFCERTFTKDALKNLANLEDNVDKKRCSLLDLKSCAGS